MLTFLAVLAVALSWVVLNVRSDIRTRRAWRVEEARAEENRRTLAYIAETDPEAFAWREVSP